MQSCCISGNVLSFYVDHTRHHGSSIVYIHIYCIFFRKTKNIHEKDATRGRTTFTIGSTKHSNLQNHTDENNVVLQQSNQSYELAGRISVASDSPYNEAEDGTYDHLGNKGARKTPADDNYYQTSCNELSDLSDYDIANHKRLNAENGTYDHLVLQIIHTAILN